MMINGQWSNKLTTAPAIEPVTAAELQTHLRENSTSLTDSVADAFITEARQWIEEVLGCAMITQSWTLTLDAWPAPRMAWWDGVREGYIGAMETEGGRPDVYLPRWPLASITSCTTYDEAGTATVVVVADKFNVDTPGHIGRITLKAGQTWPVALQANNAIKIVYAAGYGAAASDVPALMRRGVKQLAAALYTNRGDCLAEGGIAKSLLADLTSVYRHVRV